MTHTTRKVVWQHGDSFEGYEMLRGGQELPGVSEAEDDNELASFSLEGAVFELADVSVTKFGRK